MDNSLPYCVISQVNFRPVLKGARSTVMYFFELLQTKKLYGRYASVNPRDENLGTTLRDTEEVSRGDEDIEGRSENF